MQSTRSQAFDLWYMFPDKAIIAKLRLIFFEKVFMFFKILRQSRVDMLYSKN